VLICSFVAFFLTAGLGYGFIPGSFLGMIILLLFLLPSFRVAFTEFLDSQDLGFFLVLFLPISLTSEQCTAKGFTQDVFLFVSQSDLISLIFDSNDLALS